MRCACLCGFSPERFQINNVGRTACRKKLAEAGDASVSALMIRFRTRNMSPPTRDTQAASCQRPLTLPCCRLLSHHFTTVTQFSTYRSYLCKCCVWRIIYSLGTNPQIFSSLISISPTQIIDCASSFWVSYADIPAAVFYRSAQGFG